MRLYSYVVARDYGFAPNPFHGSCSLATCKPRIRKTAKVGDWIVGTASIQRRPIGNLTYVMMINEKITFDEYWQDPRFRLKKPNLYGSMAMAFGDNIYHRENISSPWRQEDSHHSNRDGTPIETNVTADTEVNAVFVSTQFSYWGGEGPAVPVDFRDWGGKDLVCPGVGHKCRFPTDMVEAFLDWYTSLGETGYISDPLEFEHELAKWK